MCMGSDEGTPNETPVINGSEDCPECAALEFWCRKYGIKTKRETNGFNVVFVFWRGETYSPMEFKLAAAQSIAVGA